MRSRFYAIPVLVFVVCATVAGTMAHRHRAKIADIVNTAGRNRWPIVATTSGAWSFALTLHTLDGRPAQLAPTRSLMSERSLFLDDGTLLLLPWASQDALKVELPGFAVRPAPDVSLPGNATQPFGTRGFSLVQLTSQRAVRVATDLNRIAIQDIATGVVDERAIGGAPPWAKSGTQAPWNWEFAISPDGRALLARHSLGSSATYGYYAPGGGFKYGKNSFWLYGIDEDQWTHLVDVNDAGEFVVGPEGRVIGICASTGGSSEVGFYEGATGKITQQVPDATSPVIGDKWAGCVQRSTASSTALHRGGGKIVLFDMHNGWERHEIASSAYAGMWGPLALYEPLANGLDGMLDNYTPEEPVN